MLAPGLASGFVLGSNIAPASARNAVTMIDGMPRDDATRSTRRRRRRKTSKLQLRVQAAVLSARDRELRKRWRQDEPAPWKEERLRMRQELKDSGLFEAMKMRDSDEIEDCENEYELVARASKEIEWMLEHDFGAPENIGLKAKCRAARTANDEPLPPKLIFHPGIVTRQKLAAQYWSLGASIVNMGPRLHKWMPPRDTS